MIEIKTLGRTKVSVNGVPLSGEAAWPKSLALIVYMAREPGPDRREEILGVLWPDLDEKRARRALNQLLYTLRKASPELDLESVSDALDFGKEVWLDVEEFERRIDAGDLKGAVELYKGPFLVDVSVGEPEFDHWADRQRAGLRRKFRRAALELAEQAKQAGDHAEAVGYCQRLVEVDPLDDEAQHLLIECLYLRGDRLAALRHYERYRELLAQELELEPLDHTRELIDRIRRESPAGERVIEPEAEAEVGAGEASEPGPREAAGEAVAGAASERASLIGRLGFRSLAALAALVVVTGLLGVWLWPRGTTERPLAAAAGSLASGELRVAVLPLTPHGLGADDEGLSAGVAQLLSLELNDAEGVTTVPHHSVVQHWQAGGAAAASVLDSGSLNALAEELQANAILVGDLHASGRELQVVAEILEAGSGSLLAEAHVRGPRDSLFTLLDDLTLALTRQLRPSPDSTTSTNPPGQDG
jgi:DNA-binding SARP family transcriptional activator/TolB-like protein